MKNGNVVLIILAVIVVLSGVGCTSLPRQKNVSLITPALQPQVMVALPAPPPSNDEQYLVGSTVDGNSQSLFGGYKPDKVYTSKEDLQNLSPQTRFKPDESLGGKIESQKYQPRPEKRVAAARPHVHRPYPVSGKMWTHECYDCPEKLGLAPPPISQAVPSPQTYSQPQRETSKRLFGRGHIRNDSGGEVRTREVIAKDIPGGVNNVIINTRSYKHHTDSTDTHGAYPEGGW